MVYKYLRRAVRIFLNRGNSKVSKENAVNIARISERGERVVFISSYPRSGNTWIRSLLADCFIQNMGLKTTTQLPIHVDKIIPDRYCNMISERNTSIKTPGLFVKTHDPFETVLELLHSTSHKNMRHVYIYRRPEDTLVSYYHFHRRYEHLISITSEGIDAFCLAKVDDWISNIESYIKARDMYGNCIFFVSYESMLSNTENTLKSIFSWLEIPIEAPVLRHAIFNMSFKNLRTNEEKNPINKEEFFFRKGRMGSGSEELQASTLDIISEKTSEVLQMANSIFSEQGAGVKNFEGGSKELPVSNEAQNI